MRNYGTGQGKDGAVVPPAGGVFAREALPENIFPPSPQQQAEGAIPLDTYPAGWFNQFHNYYTQQFNELSLDIADLFTELINTLNAAGLIPNKLQHIQLLSAIKEIASERVKGEIETYDIEFTATVQAQPLVSGDSIGTLFAKLARWWTKLTETDATNFTADFVKNTSVLPLIPGSTMSDLFGRIAKWYDRLMKPNESILDTFVKANDFQPLVPGDSLTTIAGKLLKWYYVIADAEATGLIPVQLDSPTTDPPENFGYLWVDPLLNRVRCKAMIDGVLREVPIGGDGGSGGNQVRPLEVNFLTNNPYLDPDGLRIPAGPASAYTPYPNRPTELPGITWVDPIDQNFSQVVFENENGVQAIIQKGTQMYVPAAGQHSYLCKTQDIDGFASEGVDVGDMEYITDYRCYPVRATIFNEAPRVMNIEFSRRILTPSWSSGQDWPNCLIYELDGPDSQNPPIGRIYIDVLSYSPETKILSVIARNNAVFQQDHYYAFKYAQDDPDMGWPAIFTENPVAELIPQIGGNGSNGFMIENYSGYVFPVFGAAYIIATEIRQIIVGFNKPLTSNLAGWSVTGIAGQFIGVESVENTLIFSLNKPIKHTDEVVINYNSAQGNAIDNENQKLADITLQPVTNASLYMPTQIVYAQVTEAQPTLIVADFDSTVYMSNDTGWSLDSPRGITILTAVATNNSITFTLSGPLIDGDGVHLNYTDGAGTGGTSDYEHQPLLNIVNFPVTNNIADLNPEVVNGYVSASESNVVHLTFNNPINMTNITGWSLTGAARTITGFTIEENNTLHLTLDGKIRIDDTPSVSYNASIGNLIIDGQNMTSFTEVLDNYSRYNIATGISALFSDIGYMTSQSYGVWNCSLDATFNDDVFIIDSIYASQYLYNPICFTDQFVPEHSSASDLAALVGNPMETVSDVVRMTETIKATIAKYGSERFNLYDYIDLPFVWFCGYNRGNREAESRTVIDYRQGSFSWRKSDLVAGGTFPATRFEIVSRNYMSGIGANPVMENVIFNNRCSWCQDQYGDNIVDRGTHFYGYGYRYSSDVAILANPNTYWFNNAPYNHIFYSVHNFLIDYIIRTWGILSEVCGSIRHYEQISGNTSNPVINMRNNTFFVPHEYDLIGNWNVASSNNTLVNPGGMEGLVAGASHRIKWANYSSMGRYYTSSKAAANATNIVSVSTGGSVATDAGTNYNGFSICFPICVPMLGRGQ